MEFYDVGAVVFRSNVETMLGNPAQNEVKISGEAP
jgi:hypothetical protein